MSDHEEPVAKLAKFEDSMEELDEGQEEWLSEGILTDDDYHPAADNDSSTIQSQDETMEPPEDSADVFKDHTNIEKPNDTELNTDKIEEALDNMEKTDENEDDLPGDLGTFFIRKTNGRIIETRDDSEMDSVKHSDEDANDTDELLRMLGDDDQKIKKKKEVRKIVEKKKPNEQHSTDEEDTFENVKVTRLKTKKVVLKKVPTKAVPEVTSDEETSTKVMSKTKGPKKTILKKVLTKAMSEDLSDEENTSTKTRLRMAKQAILKKVPTKAVPEDLSDDENVSSDDRSVVKKMFNVKRKVHFAAKSTSKSSLSGKPNKTSSDDSSKSKLKSLQKAQKPKTVQMKVEEPEEIINEEEFLDEDAFEVEELQEDLESDGESRVRKQPIMRPERMDEEFPSDGDSGSEENSFYDELPSTDSDEDLEEWFTLDIRSERAGDYLPLLGAKAHSVLAEERERIARRVAALRENLAAVAEGSRAQAEQLRRAAAAAASLDAAIQAA